MSKNYPKYIYSFLNMLKVFDFIFHYILFYFILINFCYLNNLFILNICLF